MSDVKNLVEIRRALSRLVKPMEAACVRAAERSEDGAECCCEFCMSLRVARGSIAQALDLLDDAIENERDCYAAEQRQRDRGKG